MLPPREDTEHVDLIFLIIHTMASNGTRSIEWKNSQLSWIDKANIEGKRGFLFR